MRKRQHETIREELVRRRDMTLTEACKHMRELRSQERRGCDGSRDGSDADETHLRLTLADQERGELLRIDAAIKSIRNGTYGKCQGCQCNIGSARLEAVPFARECLNCKKAAEEEALGGGLALGTATI